MRIQATLWTLVAAYFGVIASIYFVTSGDPAGTVILLTGCPFGGLIVGWLWNWQRQHATPVSDLVGAEADDAAGVVGVYTTDSIRPLALAVAFIGIWVGLVVGLWLSGAALALLASQVALIVRDTDP